MSNNTKILLCDFGGTHARFAQFAHKGHYEHFRKYRLNDFQSFEDIIQQYCDDTHSEFHHARFAMARTLIDGRITYKRHAGDPDYIIDFNKIETLFQWKTAEYYNDLEAAAHGLNVLTNSQVNPLFETPSKTSWNHHKIIISVGTGVGHACIFNQSVMQTPGGHWLPITVTKEHKEVEAFIRHKKDPEFSLIMEDFVSGHGLRSIAEHLSGETNDHLTPTEFIHDLQNHPNAIRLFFEFLGLYAHNIASVTGFYGGLYLTGGVIDNLVKHNLTNWTAFETYFRPNMVPVVNDRLQSTPVFYVLHDELPLLGLTSV